ncbi:MAG: T9SS type A sorting domain-containing protein [Ignavibacteria bacterium]|nr:T9SS type A sorting domain-containing protein [Ignavibacteria bacterium]
MGDYIGVTSSADYVMPCWDDNRRIVYQAFAARFGPLRVSTALTSGWNLVSVPIIVSNFSRGAVWPTATSYPFAYGPTSYVPKDPVANGPGYWVKFDGNQTVTQNGTPLTAVSDSVYSGWNIIGSLSVPIAVSTVTAVPDTIIGSKFFGYNAGYFIADTIKPGSGYWVKAKTAGRIILDVASTANRPPSASTETLPAPPPPPPPAAPVLSCSNCSTPDANPSFTWTASSGAVSYLASRYVCNWIDGDCNGTASVIASTADLAFTDYSVKVFHKGPDGITPTYTYYYYVVAKDAYDQLSSGSNKKAVNTGNYQQKQAVLPPTEAQPLPTKTILRDSYPNPFNPTTIVHYALSEGVYVKLVVYDMLGRIVQVLVDEIEDAGYKTAAFDASGLPSGVYLYRMQAGSYVDTKKMLLMK